MNREGCYRTRWRWLMLSVFVLLALGGCLLSVMQGVAAITPADVLQILWQPSARTADQIIWNIRLPRTLTGALVGANLALSGAILQAVMRNPLADPHIIGISAGAGLAGIVVLIVWPAYLFWMTPVAFVGAMAAAAVIYLLAWKDGIVPVRIILAGVAVSAFLGAIISGILIFYSDRVHGALLWMVGGLAASSWKDVTAIA
ncbi:iron ABC transporter permease, partial [Megasphaera sp.]